MILVTGATGFVGRSLTRILEEDGRAWRAYQGHLNDPMALQAQLEGVETVIHLASAEARGRNRLLRRVDIDGGRQLLRQCVRAEVRRLIVPSRLGADPNDVHPLLRAKGQIERMVRQSGLDYTILRAATLFGHDDRFTEIIAGLALWSWPFVWLPGGGRVAMQPLWVEDFARCLRLTLDRDDLIGKTVAVAGEERFRYEAIVRLVLRAGGIRRLPLSIPLVLIRPLSGALFGWWYWPAASRYFVDRFFVPEVIDADSLRRHYNFRPTPLGAATAYLRRARLRWRIFRR